MNLGEFIVSEFWMILLILVMVINKPYRVSGILLLFNKAIGDNPTPLIILFMVLLGLVLDLEQRTGMFLNKNIWKNKKNKGGV